MAAVGAKTAATAVALSTEGIAERKMQIEAKLHSDEQNILFLKESLERSGRTTKAMLDLLSSFEERLLTLEASIRPIHLDTSLTRAQENIITTVKGIDGVLAYYDVHNEVKATVERGVQAQLHSYIDSMERIAKALQYFQRAAPLGADKTIAKLKGLFEQGVSNLEGEFKTVLLTNSKAVDVGGLLEMESGAELPSAMEDAVVERLANIADWLCRVNKTAVFTQVYADNRGRMMADSLMVVHAVQGPTISLNPAIQKLGGGGTSHRRTGSSASVESAGNRSRWLRWWALATSAADRASLLRCQRASRGNRRRTRRALARSS
eukprot:Opistho-1_new@59064